MLPNNVTSENIATEYEGFIKEKEVDFVTNKRYVIDKKTEKWSKLEKELEREYLIVEKTNDAEDIKKKKYERALLLVLKKYGLKMNIYFLEANEGSFNSSWQQLTLNNNSQVQYTTIN